MTTNSKQLKQTSNKKMMTMKPFPILIFYSLLLALLLSTFQQKHVAAATESDIITGKPHTTVQALTETNFDQALNDPANGLWLLKFYGMLITS